MKIPSIIPIEGDPVSSISDFMQKMLQDPLVLLIVGTLAFVAIWVLAESSSWSKLPKKI